MCHKYALSIGNSIVNHSTSRVILVVMSFCLLHCILSLLPACIHCLNDLSKRLKNTITIAFIIILSKVCGFG